MTGLGAHAASVPTPTKTVRWLPSLLQPTFEELLPRTRVERTRKDWLFDGLLVILTIATGALAIAFTPERTGERLQLDGWWLVDAILLVPVAVLLLWRRRWPVPIAIAVGFLTLLAPSAGLAVVVAGFAVGAYAPPPRALPVLGLLMVLGPIGSYVWSERSPDQWWSDGLFTVLSMTLIGAWGMYTGTRRQLLVTLHERARRAEADQHARLDQARQQERTRIAREMHDVLAHRMSLLSVHAGALEYRPDAPPEEISRAAGVIRQTAHEALEELRAVIGVLRASDLAALSEGAAPEPPQPTLAELPELLGSWTAAGVAVESEVQLDVSRLPAPLGRAAYRIVQEGLTNAGKHAPGARVRVQLAGAPGDALRVRVVNALPVGGGGRGIPGFGAGLVGLRERAELLGGTLQAAERSTAREFMLEATLPWSAP